MVRVNFIIMMDQFIEVNGNLVNKMDMDNLKIKMVRLLKEIGLMENLLNEKKNKFFLCLILLNINKLH